ncbi:unnamed protein product, partial [Ceratitis capitata]
MALDDYFSINLVNVLGGGVSTPKHQRTCTARYPHSSLAIHISKYYILNFRRRRRTTTTTTAHNIVLLKAKIYHWKLTRVERSSKTAISRHVAGDLGSIVDPNKPSFTVRLPGRAKSLKAPNPLDTLTEARA